MFSYLSSNKNDAERENSSKSTSGQQASPQTIYNNLPEEQKQKQSYSEWVREYYDTKYEEWVPWLEDKYLAWFGKDNKASYATKAQLDQTKITGNAQIDKVQDGVNDLVSGQVGKGGLLQPVGDLASKEGVNRMERGGKDDQGSYGGSILGGVTDPMMQGGKGAAGYVGGLMGGGQEKAK